jgi:hypothetical protein
MLHPEGVRTGVLASIRSEGESDISPQSSPQFHIHSSLDPSDTFVVRQFYHIRVTGEHRSTTLGGVNALEISLIILERFIELDSEEVDFSKLLPHGSNSVLLMGQPRRVFQAKYMTVGVENIAMSHELSVCFTQTGNFTIYSLWSEHFADRVGTERIWFTTKPIHVYVSGPRN